LLKWPLPNIDFLKFIRCGQIYWVVTKKTNLASENPREDTISKKEYPECLKWSIFYGAIRATGRLFPGCYIDTRRLAALI
jgi:hypothetical protein